MKQAARRPPVHEPRLVFSSLGQGGSPRLHRRQRAFIEIIKLGHFIGADAGDERGDVEIVRPGAGGLFVWSDVRPLGFIAPLADKSIFDLLDLTIAPRRALCRLGARGFVNEG